MLFFLRFILHFYIYSLKPLAPGAEIGESDRSAGREIHVENKFVVNKYETKMGYADTQYVCCWLDSWAGVVRASQQFRVYVIPPV